MYLVGINEEQKKDYDAGKSIIVKKSSKPMAAKNTQSIENKNAIKQIPGKKAEIIDGKVYYITKNQWEPQPGKYYVNSYGEVDPFPFQKVRYQLFGLVRDTKEATEEARDKMCRFNRLLAYVDEYAPNYDKRKVDYRDLKEIHYFIYYDLSMNIYHVGAQAAEMEILPCYMPENIANDLCDKLNKGEVDLTSYT